MKKVYLLLSSLFFILGIIICFENIIIPPNGMMIFFSVQSGTSMFFPLMYVLAIGGISGFFLGLTLGGKGDDIEDTYNDLEL